MYNTSPLSEGDGGSLSSRSSAEDMVPVDGVLGSLLLKSPGKWQKGIICFNTLFLQLLQMDYCKKQSFTKLYTDDTLPHLFDQKYSKTF